jgi:AraC-like DNA-binding protein
VRAAFRETTPPSHLAEIVRAFWYQGPSSSVARRPVVPDGCLDVIVEVTSEREMSALIFGPTSALEVVTLEHGVTYAGVRFQPWVGAPLVGRKGAELVGRVEDASELVPSLYARLADADPDTLIDALAKVATDLANVLHWNGAQRLVRETYGLLEDPDSLASVVDIARALGVSERTLRRAFDAVTGSGPKTAMRIARLQRSLRLLSDGGRAADIATECGFADQAHLTNELRVLAGVTPALVFRRSAGVADICKTAAPAKA